MKTLMISLRKVVDGAIRWIGLSIEFITMLLRGLVGLTGLLIVCVGLMLLGAAGLSSCAQSVRLTGSEIPLVEGLKNCPGTKLPPANELADAIELLTTAQVYALKESMARVNCEDKNKILYGLIEKHNEQVREMNNRNWWERLFG